MAGKYDVFEWNLWLLHKLQEFNHLYEAVALIAFAERSTHQVGRTLTKCFIICCQKQVLRKRGSPENVQENHVMTVLTFLTLEISDFFFRSKSKKIFAKVLLLSSIVQLFCQKCSFFCSIHNDDSCCEYHLFNETELRFKQLTAG